jgi:Domain of unknown function (DUF4268)
MTSSLGRLVRINLREVWDSESSAFTPWLAQEDNLQFLGEAIGIELELESTEQNVGLFRADIVCKDTATDQVVLIENQLEATDHKHLGQLLTYAAGLKAATIIWIADRFTDEHRAAMDWLNNITDDEFNFFGLEVELWRIGNSLTAPKFNIISKPNEWTKRSTSSSITDITPTKQLQLEYWTVFVSYLKQKGFTKTPKPYSQHWMNFAIGRSGFLVQPFVNTRENNIGIILELSGKFAKSHYTLLMAEKDSIQQEIQEPLEWHELPTRKDSKIVLRRPNTMPSNTESWPIQHAWLHEKLALFRAVFSPRIKKLNVLPAAQIDELSDITQEIL